MNLTIGNPNRRLLIFTGIIAVITGIMAVYAHSLPFFPGDLKFTILFQSLQNDMLLTLMRWISFAAESWRQLVIVAIASSVLWGQLGKTQAVLILVAELTNLFVLVMKSSIDRPRPSADLIQVFELKNNASFPSGHAFFAVVVLGLLAYFALTYIQKRSLRIGIFIILVTLILMIGASRVYLGAHWPSDVLGGFGAGGFFLGVLIWLDKKLNRQQI